MSEKFKKVNIVFFAALLTIIIINVIVHIANRNINVGGKNLHQTSSSITDDGSLIGIESSNNDAADIPKNKADDSIIIVIDAGHGGVDPGAVNEFGENESVINLEISKYLKGFLETTGFDVIMTRSNLNGLYDEGKNTTIREKKNEDLDNRVRIINASEADLIVSIHLNAFTQSRYYGAQSFYKNKCDKSKSAAEIMQKNLKNILDKNNGRVPQSKRDMRILDESNFPIILVECGFVSNPEEGRILSTADYQEKVAWAIYAGIIEYFEKNVSAR